MVQKTKGPLGPQRRREPESTYHAQVLEKLKAHPTYQECSQQDLAMLAHRLSRAEELAQYFDLTREGDNGAAQTEEIEALEVELVLNYLPRKPGSTLLQEYGPLQAYLVIGGVVLEWDCTSIIVPHGKPMKTDDRPPAVVGRTAELPCIRVKVLKEKVLDIVSCYNRKYHYHATQRSAHDFVRAVLEKMACPVPPQLQNKLKEYIRAIEGSASGFIPRSFETHSDLDQFVDENGRRCTGKSIDAEYLVLHYFTLHTSERTKQANPLEWECQEPNCRAKILEKSVDEKELLLNQFKTVQYDFN